MCGITKYTTKMIGDKKNLKIVSLNVRGMISKNKRERIFLWLKRHKVDFACLQETHCTLSKMNIFKNGWKGKCLSLV